jgi:hypothetical protein
MLYPVPGTVPGTRAAVDKKKTSDHRTKDHHRTKILLKIGMGQFPSPAGPNDVVILQYGGGQQCDCGPARFEPSQVAADNRLLSRGVSPEEVRAKFQDLSAKLRKFRNPLVFILLPLFIGLVLTFVLQLLPVLGHKSHKRALSASLVCPIGQPRTTKTDKLIWPDQKGDMRSCGQADEYVSEYCNKDKDEGCYNHIVRTCCGRDNACKGQRVCERHEVDDPFGNKCCNFYCCAEDKAQQGGESWDMKGPSWTTEPPPECPLMRPGDSIFRLSGGDWEDPDLITADGAKLYAAPWFNQTLTLGDYAKTPPMDLGCQCNVRHDSRNPNQRWFPTCSKMLVSGEFRSERHYSERRDDDEPLSFLTVLRYMGGLIMFIFLIPGICLWKRQRDAKRKMVTEFFADWVQRRIVQRVSYFPGGKHAQARLTLHLAAGTVCGGAAVQMVVAQPVVLSSSMPVVTQPVVLSSSKPVATQQHHGDASTSQVMPFPVRPVPKQ